MSAASGIIARNQKGKDKAKMEKTKRGSRLSGYRPDYVVFDLETTGLSPEADEIIEISAVKVKGGAVISTFSSLVNPGRPIPKAASMVNGITDEMVAGEPGLKEVMDRFLPFIENQILVGHNIHSFDMKFLYHAVSELYQKELANNYIDTLFMARSCLKELPHHRLTDVAAYFHISTQGAHRALNDCVMNQKCFEELGKRMPKAQAGEAEICPRCGGELVKRNGRFGAFYGCSNFPACRYTRNG